MANDSDRNPLEFKASPAIPHWIGEDSEPLIFNKLTTISMKTVKQEISLLLNNLPDDCSLEEVQYHIYVLEKVRQALDVADRDRTLSQDEAENLLSKWLIK